MQNKPLDGIRVTDFGWILSVPHATAYLGTLGADVIRVETEVRLDLIRVQGMNRGVDGVTGLNRSGAFNGLNYSKRGVTLNLAKPEGKDLALRLVEQSDIVTENFSTGVIDRLGLGYEELCKVRPDLIMLSGSPVGLTGPEAAATGWGPTTLAYTGLPWITGYPGGPPAAYGGAYPDFMISLQMVFSILVALHERERTGKGQHIDLSMAETVVAMTPEPLFDHEFNGRDGTRDGNHHPVFAPQGVYRTAGDDTWIAISIETDEQWSALVDAMERPTWALDAGLATARGRRERHDDIDEGITAWTRGHDAHDLAGKAPGARHPRRAGVGPSRPRGRRHVARARLPHADRPPRGRISRGCGHARPLQRHARARLRPRADARPAQPRRVLRPPRRPRGGVRAALRRGRHRLDRGYAPRAQRASALSGAVISSTDV